MLVFGYRGSNVTYRLKIQWVFLILRWLL